jgi:hypothetical protein
MSNLCNDIIENVGVKITFISLLQSLNLISTSTNRLSTYDDFTHTLMQRSGQNGLHHAVIEIIDCILFRPFDVKLTDEYIDVWSGLYELKKTSYPPQKWNLVKQCMMSLVEDGVANIHTNKWYPDKDTIVFNGHMEHNTMTYRNLPWRMNTLQTFLASLLNTGLHCRDLQVEIAQALQVGCRQSANRLRLDRIEHTMLPDEEHRLCLLSSLPKVTAAMAAAWENKF